MTNLTEIYVTCFNEILNGEFTGNAVLPEREKERNKFALEHTRNTLLYEWFKDNGELDYIDGMFENVLMPKTDPDLSGVSFNELVFVVSPETKRIIRKAVNND